MEPVPPRARKPRATSWAVSVVLLGIGAVIGVLVASEADWLPFGHAVPDPQERSAPPPPTFAGLPGKDRNFVQIAKAVTPAVVNIFTTRAGQAPEGPHASPFDDPFFRRFFGDEFFRRFEAPRARKERSLGSGVVVAADGYIVTNHHVVNKADEIKVLMSDKREFKAKLIGSDSKTDLAVLKVEADGLHTVPWSDSDKLEVGEFVLAVGNPFGLTQTVTMGIVSAVGRASMGIAEYEDFIQTDAAINPGNSGGALVNTKGELVGINTAIYSQSGGNMGIGFAVPSNMARSILEQLVKNGKVVRGWLGVSIQELSPELASQFGLPDTKGVLVSDVLEGSPAKRAGFERGDVIVAFDGKPVDTPTHLRNVVAQALVGKKVTVKFVRDKKERTVEVTIAEQPKSMGQEGREEGGDTSASAGVLADVDVHEVTPELAARYGLSGSDRGVLITRIRSGSVAEDAGLKEGDLIMEVNRKDVPNLKAYERIAAGIKKGEAVLLLIKRQGRTSYVTVKP
jgi:serine protease Do